MKKYIAISLICLTAIKLNAQFTIDSVKIFPKIIHANDSVTFIDFITSPGLYTEVKR